MNQTTDSPSPQNRPADRHDWSESASVFVPSQESLVRSSRRRRLIALSMLFLAAVGAVCIMVAWPYFHQRRLDPVERVAGAYLQALVREDHRAARRLGTVEEPPAIRSVRSIGREAGRDRVLKGSFAPLADLHVRIDSEYAYDPSAGRYTPKNPLGAAAQTLDALHAAKEDAQTSRLAEKIASGSPDDLFDAAEQLAKVWTGLAEGALSPQRILPTYKMLVDSSKPPLPEGARVLALEVAASSKSWDALLKRPFHTLKADGPFVYERAEVTATVADRLASLGDPPSRLRLSLVRFRLEGIDTGWKVVAARRVRAGEPDMEPQTPTTASPLASSGESPSEAGASRSPQDAPGAR